MVWVPRAIFGLILLLPEHLGRADCKREPRRVGEGSGGGAAGVGSAAGEMPKNQNKTRFHFVCTSLGAGESGRRGREREAHANRKPPCSGAGLRPRPSAAAPAAVPAPSSPSPCPPGFACQVRVGTAPQAAPNKAVTHPRAGADSKQSDRRIFRMLIQTARRRASGGAPPCHAHTAPRHRATHPTLGTRRPRWPRAGMARPQPAGAPKAPRRRGLNRAEALLGGQTRPLGICCTCSRCLHLALEP